MGCRGLSICITPFQCLRLMAALSCGAGLPNGMAKKQEAVLTASCFCILLLSAVQRERSLRFIPSESKQLFNGGVEHLLDIHGQSQRRIVPAALQMDKRKGRFSLAMYQIYLDYCKKLKMMIAPNPYIGNHEPYKRLGCPICTAGTKHSSSPRPIRESSI